MYNFLRKKIRENSVRVLGDLGFDRCGSPFLPWSLEDEARKGRKKGRPWEELEGEKLPGSGLSPLSPHPTHTPTNKPTPTHFRGLCAPHPHAEKLSSRDLFVTPHLRLHTHSFFPSPHPGVNQL